VRGVSSLSIPFSSSGLRRRVISELVVSDTTLLDRIVGEVSEWVTQRFRGEIIWTWTSSTIDLFVEIDTWRGLTVQGGDQDPDAEIKFDSRTTLAIGGGGDREERRESKAWERDQERSFNIFLNNSSSHALLIEEDLWERGEELDVRAFGGFWSFDDPDVVIAREVSLRSRERLEARELIDSLDEEWGVAHERDGEALEIRARVSWKRRGEGGRRRWEKLCTPEKNLIPLLVRESEETGVRGGDGESREGRGGRRMRFSRLVRVQWSGLEESEVGRQHRQTIANERERWFRRRLSLWISSLNPLEREERSGEWEGKTRFPHLNKNRNNSWDLKVINKLISLKWIA
jgi:hypothetical protein